MIMEDPEEYSTDINNLWEEVKELEKKLESLDKDMNTVFEAINAFYHILYLKNPEEK